MKGIYLSNCFISAKAYRPRDRRITLHARRALQRAGETFGDDNRSNKREKRTAITQA